MTKHGRDEQARRLRELRRNEHIRRIVDQAPPLADAQHTRLAALLRPSATYSGRLR